METGRTNHYDKVLDSVLGEKNFVNYYMAVGLSVENPFNYHEIAEYKKGTGGFFKKFIGCFLGFIPGRTVLADIESESKSAKNEHDPSDYNLKYDGLRIRIREKTSKEDITKIMDVAKTLEQKLGEKVEVISV